LWHCRRGCFREFGHPASTFLRPFAPRTLLRFNATMNALTPVRSALPRGGLGQYLPVSPPFRLAWQMGTRPCRYGWLTVLARTGITDSCTVSYPSFCLQPPKCVRTSRCCSQWRARPASAMLELAACGFEASPMPSRLATQPRPNRVRKRSPEKLKILENWRS
jgi:hypothetical protein